MLYCETLGQQQPENGDGPAAGVESGVTRGQNFLHCHQAAWLHREAFTCACEGPCCRVLLGAATGVLINVLIDWSFEEGKVKVHGETSQPAYRSVVYSSRTS